MSRLPASEALARFKVLDLTRVRAGPTCVRQLADWGADVVKIEMPDGAQGGARPPEQEPREHPTGQPDPNHSQPTPGQRVLGGDPVDLFTGAFTIDETDPSVESAAVPLDFTRLYRSGRAYYGPFGWGWDHNHNSYVRELADGSVAHRNSSSLSDANGRRVTAFTLPRRSSAKSLEYSPHPLRGPVVVKS